MKRLASAAAAFAVAASAGAASFPAVSSKTVTIHGDWFGHTTPSASYVAYQNPGDTFRILCPSPCKIDPNVIAAFHFGFAQAAQRTIDFFGLDILPDLKPIDLHVANDTWCGNYQPGFTGDSSVYPASSGLTTAYGCFWYADRPDFFEPFTAANVSQVSYHLLTVHEYTHPIFFERHFYSYEDFAKAASFFVSGVGGAAPITDPCDDRLFDLNQGRLVWALCRDAGFAYADLPSAMQQLDALYHSGKGAIDQGSPPKTSVFQFRRILDGVLGAGTRDAFLAALTPPGQVEDDAVLPAAGGVAWMLGGWIAVEVPPGALPGDRAIHASALYSLPAGASISNLDFDSIYLLSPSPGFARPARVRFKYDPSLLPTGVGEETLRLYRLSGSSWAAVPGARVDTIHSEVVAPVSSLGTFGFFGTASSPAAASSVVSGIGSVQGAGGASFRTSLQIHDGGESGSTGSLVFRAPGNPADGKMVAYGLRSGETATYDDLLAAFGATGLGSLEIVPASGPAPVASARIFADGGAAGTSGFSEEGEKESAALGAGDSAILLAPPDIAAQRFNVGVRPLGEGVTLSTVVRNAAGAVVGTRVRSFPPTALDQETAASFAGVAFSGNESLTITVTAGRAFVYGVGVDNRTNDTSFEAARALAFAPAEGGVEYVSSVGSLAGAHGANFRTALQLHNDSAALAAGRLVYHPTGRTASAGDPSLAYSLAPGQTVSFGDLLPAMGQSGLGTLDVVSTAGPPPVVLARVFNDLGAGGTLGLAEEGATVSDVLKAGDRADLLVPDDLSKQRINVGVRTFGASVLAMTISDHNGFFQGPHPFLTVSIPAGQFEQLSLADFLHGAALPPGGSVRIEVIGGEVLLFDAVTDNTTNDPGYRIARRL
ncbi:MAG TPA: hypothetical protein VFL12_00055, partial [Thermoanaerobaculia bacterium]|nr:hypothetical protein [Thermoanaerobaculia bacterium]